MKRFLHLLPILVGAPCFAGDLGPADLATEQISAGFPPLGTKWTAWCGSWKKNVECTAELGENGLIVDDAFEIAYESLIRSEKWDSMMAITRLAKLDPAWAGWKNYRRTTQVSALANTVLIEYITKKGKKQAALFTFPANRVSEWYGFANAMRLITYGARPEKRPTQPR